MMPGIPRLYEIKNPVHIDALDPLHLPSQELERQGFSQDFGIGGDIGGFPGKVAGIEKCVDMQAADQKIRQIAFLRRRPGGFTRRLRFLLGPAAEIGLEARVPLIPLFPPAANAGAEQQPAQVGKTLG